ncbi:MAG TPA: glycosyltransferase family 1 protein [Anaerolineae bacterium]|nr:glycosyltransferase family 1 protein [Anaerolineae bacterium]
MRIGLDCSSAIHQRAGIARYTRGIVSALARLGGEHRFVLVVAGREAGSDFALELGENFLVRELPISQRLWTILWYRLQVPLPMELFTGAVDVFHSPDYVLPPLRRGKKVVTVHDLSFVRYPEGAEPSLRRYLSAAVPRAVKQADLVLADSECTRRDVIELLGAPPAKVEVVYPGVDEAFRPIEDAQALAGVREHYQLNRPFLLSVGTLEPRKNFIALLEAYAALRGVDGFEHRLVIAGGKGWRYEGIFRRVEELSLEGDVSFLKYVPEQDLPALYCLADALVFPSVYEGFGLPPLEAMACGTPVVASDSSSLPEVIGDAGLMVPADDRDALAGAIRRLLEDGKLRGELVKKGLSRAGKFSWQKTGQDLLAIYRRLYES